MLVRIFCLRVPFLIKPKIPGLTQCGAVFQENEA
jgi:hypothetical protein